MAQSKSVPEFYIHCMFVVLTWTYLWRKQIFSVKTNIQKSHHYIYLHSVFLSSDEGSLWRAMLKVLQTVPLMYTFRCFLYDKTPSMITNQQGPILKLFQSFYYFFHTKYNITPLNTLQEWHFIVLLELCSDTWTCKFNYSIYVPVFSYYTSILACITMSP